MSDVDLRSAKQADVPRLTELVDAERFTRS
jgi:hypothetical protein